MDQGGENEGEMGEQKVGGCFGRGKRIDRGIRRGGGGNGSRFSGLRSGGMYAPPEDPDADPSPSPPPLQPPRAPGPQKTKKSRSSPR